MSADFEYHIEKEREAVKLLNDFLEANKETLIYIASWGDGKCGYFAETAKSKLLGESCMGERQGRKTYTKKKISGELRIQVYERDKYRCKHCGTHKNLSLDHIIPESKGGTATLDNLQTLCRPCNSKKAVKMPEGGE